MVDSLCSLCDPGNANRILLVVALAWPLISAMALTVLKSLASAEYLKAHPRYAGFLHALEGLGLDPTKVYQGLTVFFSKKVPPTHI